MMIADVDIIVSAYKMMFTWLLEMVYYTEDADMITRWRSHLSAAVLSILHHHRELEIILRLRLNPAFVLKIWNLVFVLKCFLQPYFCKVLLFVLKCFIQAFFIKFHWTQHVFENTFKNDNDATLPVWKKEKSSKTNARAVCNCNFKKKSLHSDNVHICKTTVCSNARHVNVSPCWMFSISLSHKPRVTASFVHWVSSSILSGYFACC